MKLYGLTYHGVKLHRYDLTHFPQLALVKIKFAGKFGFFREKSGLHFDRFGFVGHG